MRRRAKYVINGLFDVFMNDMSLLPGGWASKGSELERARLISDYLAGMTDGYADRRYTELTSGT